MNRNEIITIYNKRLNKYNTCSYGAFLDNWSNFGWIVTSKLEHIEQTKKLLEQGKIFYNPLEAKNIENLIINCDFGYGDDNI